MAFFVVPGEVSTHTATVCVYALNEGSVPDREINLILSSGDEEPGVRGVPQGRWNEWKPYDPSDAGGYAVVDRILQRFITPVDGYIVPVLHHQRVALDGLEPGSDYTVMLQVDGVPPDQLALDERATRTCTFRTLPGRLPESEDDESFNILVGSCFYRGRDLEGMVGKTFHSLPPRYKPHVKALCGDQVYLDIPFSETSLRWWGSYRNPGYFREMLLRKYCCNWQQSLPDNAAGSTCF